MDSGFPYSSRMGKKVTSEDEESVASTTAKVLGANLSALMAAHTELKSNPTVAKKTGMSSSTIHRMRHGQVDATLRTLEKLAAAFSVRPWELLVPSFDPANRPVEKPVSDRVRHLLAEAAKEMERER